MSAEIAYNLDGLDDRQILQKIKGAHDAVLNHAATFTTPNPTLASILTAHDAAASLLNQIDALDDQRKQLVILRDAAMPVAVQGYKGLGAYVQNKANGDPAVVTEGGYELVQPRGTPQPMPKVQDNAVTAGDNDGDGDAMWGSVKGAKSYELQTAASASGPWVHEATLTVSHHHLTGKPSGQKLWTRVRAVNRLGPGPWSDPACCTIP